MKHNFDEHKAQRMTNAKDRIERNESAADAHFKAADRIAKCIPPGQPVLIGHHSEKRHRKDLARIDSSMNKARTAAEKAEYYRDRVAAMESTHSISNDDPQAIEKLTEKLEKLVEIQEFMKAANKCVKKNDKDAFMKLDLATEGVWKVLVIPEILKVPGFPQYKLTNNSANIRRIHERIKELKKTAGRQTTEETVKGVRVVQNVEANRIQLIFSSKPSEKVREQLRQIHHFNWSHTEGAWQRFLNPQSIYEAKTFLNWYDPGI